MTFNFIYILCVQEMLYMCNTVTLSPVFLLRKKQKQNGKSKQKTRPPYVTWTWEKSQKQDDPEQK